VTALRGSLACNARGPGVRPAELSHRHWPAHLRSRLTRPTTAQAPETRKPPRGARSN